MGNITPSSVSAHRILCVIDCLVVKELASLGWRWNDIRHPSPLPIPATCCARRFWWAAVGRWWGQIRAIKRLSPALLPISCNPRRPPLLILPHSSHPSRPQSPKLRKKIVAANGEDIVKRLQAICTDADPTFGTFLSFKRKLYSN